MRPGASMALLLIPLIAGGTAYTFLRTDTPPEATPKGVQPHYTAQEKQLTEEMTDFRVALGLTETQTKQLESAGRTYQKAVHAIRKKYRFTKENYKQQEQRLQAELRPVERAYFRKLETIYTPAQRAKLEAYKAAVFRGLPRGRNPGLVSQ